MLYVIFDGRDLAVRPTWVGRVGGSGAGARDGRKSRWDVIY